LITIFTIPKPYEGEIGDIQQAAVRSWTRIHPEVRILLCGDEPGTREAAREWGAEYVPDIESNEYGTPLLSSAFRAAGRLARRPHLCYVNADIILLPDLVHALGRIAAGRYLLTARRLNGPSDLTSRLGPGHEAEDVEKLVKAGVLEPGPPTALDLFAFSRAPELLELPPFAVGRPGWDNWFLYNALRNRVPVIDATGAVTVVHQAHGYEHVAEARGRWSGPEGDRNRRLAGGWTTQLDLRDASHVLAERGPRAARDREHVERRLEQLPRYRPRLFRYLKSWKLRRWFVAAFPLHVVR